MLVILTIVDTKALPTITSNRYVVTMTTAAVFTRGRRKPLCSWIMHSNCVATTLCRFNRPSSNTKLADCSHVPLGSMLLIEPLVMS